MKKIISLLLSITLLLGLLGGFSMNTTAAGSTKIPTFFNDGMLFEQNKPMNLWGQASTGSVIKAELCQASDGKVLETVSTTVTGAATWNDWQLSFSPRKGGYTAYEINIYNDNNLYITIYDVVVGVLWLATGQSNMEYRLDWAIDGADEIANAKDSYLRVLLMPGDAIGTASSHPATPNFDISGARWGYGNYGGDISGMSAIAYFAAKKMRQELNMPVGIINASLGATPIQTWLSRESIESNDEVKKALMRANLYLTQEEMQGSLQANFQFMTSLYNLKIGPLAGMNLSGLLWCQGESNRDGKPNSDGYYTQALLALADGYSNAFGFENGTIPIAVIHIANHPYLGDAQNIPKWIEEVSAAAVQRPTIMNVPIYDVPLTYINPPAPNVAYSIHPNSKRQPGERAATIILHNVYQIGNADCYAPTVSSYEIKGTEIYVTFDKTAGGLTTLNPSKGVHGFTIAGENKIYLPAYSMIVNSNTVKIWNDGVAEPTRFTYAFNSHAQTANLCNSYQIPAIPYRSHAADRTFFGSNDWIFCEDTSVFVDNGVSGEFKQTWYSSQLTPREETVTVESQDRFEGTGSIRLSYKGFENHPAGAAADFAYHLMPITFQRFKTVSVMLKNCDNRDKTVRLLIGRSGHENTWMLPVAGNSMQPVYTVTLPANSDWARYDFAVGPSLGYNTEDSVSLSAVSRLEVWVEDTADGSILIDGITFGTDELRKVTPLPEHKPGIPFGDINQDSRIDAVDALWALQNAVKKRVFTEEQTIIADVDGSHTIDAKDGLLILQKAVDKISQFPVEKEE